MTGQGVQRLSDALTALEDAKRDGPAEVAVTPDGRAGVIQWQGTPVSELWVTGYVDRLIAARLVEPAAGLGRDLTEQERALMRRAADERLAAWHRALAGLPQEGLEAARIHFERHGLPAEWRRGYLKPSDVSAWVRARAVRRIPAGQECEVHEGQWAHSCRACGEERRAARSRLPEGFMERLREELARAAEDSGGEG